MLRLAPELRHTDPHDPELPEGELPEAAPSPIVSVVIANHDNARFIEAALRSVLAQTLTDIEVLVSDDASSDDGPERVAALAGRDGRVRLLRATRNGGPGAARNRALEAVRGRWIAVVDGDDLLHPDRLRRLIEAAERDGADVAADNLLVFDDADRAPPRPLLRGARWREPRWIDAAQYVRANALDGSGPALGVLKPVLRASRLRGLRYDPALRIAEDYDLVARLLADGARLRTYPFLTYFYRKHGASISHRLSRATLLPMLAADDAFRARPDLSPPLLAALDRRRASLERALGFEALVAALKARDWPAAARLAWREPAAAALLRVPLRDRLRRLRHRPPAPPAAAPRAPRVCVLSRQRVVGAMNGSSAYLLSLCEALRADGWQLDLVSPSPAVFGRWPALPLRPEMAVFRSIRVRGAWRLGRCLVSRDPGVALRAAVAASDRLLARFGVRPRGARAPFAVALPGTEADHLFVARHARGADLLLADYAFLAEAAPFALAPRAPLVVVMHDLFSSQRPPLIGLEDELRLLARADAVVAIQEEEAGVVREHLPGARVLLAPMAVPAVPAPQPGTDDRTLLFVASDTAPNREALAWLLDRCWPALRAALPDVRLLVAGSVGHALAVRPEGVSVLGPLPSLAAPYREASVVLSPLRSGSGLKIKLVEALAQGKAVVATPVTVQGVEHLVPGVVAVEDAPEGFVAAALALLRDPALRRERCLAALELARRRFSPAACHEPLLRFAASHRPPSTP